MSIENYKAEVECVCFSIYITKIITLEMGTTKLVWVTPFFSRKMVVKITKIQNFAWN